MYQFFVESSQIGCDTVSITGSDYNHITHVLRMKAGERIRVSDREGNSYFCVIQSFLEDQVLASIESRDEVGTELGNRIYLYQGLPKSEKMELIIQKAVELGVYEVIPVTMKNCVMKLEEKKIPQKIARWQAIAESAAKQSKRTIVPVVREPMSYKLALEQAKDLDLVLVPYENERGMQATREILSHIERGQSIGIFIGPEGGFADSEIEALPEGMHRISLGRRILRTETAGLATLSMLVYELDD